MILLKAFFRKKKTNIYIKIFCIIFIVLFILNGINNYIDNELNKLKQETTSLIMFAQHNHDDLINKEPKVDTYNRMLSMNQGDNSEIIYMPEIITNTDGSKSYKEEIDYTKLNWQRLIYDTNLYPYIFTFNSSYCNSNLNDKEVILALDEEKDYRKEYINDYINNEINIKHNNEEYNLIIKDIITPKTFNYICISNNLYNNLIQKEEKYIYNIKLKDYKDLKEIQNKWQSLEDNDFYNISISNYFSEIDMQERIKTLEKLVKMLKIGNIISTIIFFIITSVTIKDLIEDEKEEILLLKQVGFNNYKNLKIILKKLTIFNIIIFTFSILIFDIIVLIINKAFTFNIELFNLKYFIFTSVFIFIIELFFSTTIIMKKNE